jgi:hypothetical protein
LYLKIETPSSDVMLGGDVTVFAACYACWVNIPVDPTGSQPKDFLATEDNNRGIRLRAGGTSDFLGVTLHADTAGFNTLDVYKSSINYNQWYHILVNIYDKVAPSGLACELFVDNVSEGTASTSTSSGIQWGGVTELRLGANRTGTVLDCYIAELCCFKAELDASARTVLYESGIRGLQRMLKGYNSGDGKVQIDPLRGYWPLDDFNVGASISSGHTFIDRSQMRDTNTDDFIAHSSGTGAIVEGPGLSGLSRPIIVTRSAPVISTGPPIGGLALSGAGR